MSAIRRRVRSCAGAAGLLLSVLGPAGPPAIAEGDAPTEDTAHLSRFASQIDRELALLEDAGIYPRRRVSHFRLEGHGVVFLGEAVRAPRGVHALFFSSDGSGPGGTGLIQWSGPGSADLQDRPHVRIEIARALELAGIPPAARSDGRDTAAGPSAGNPAQLAAELAAARESLARHTEATRRLRERLSEPDDRGPAAPLTALEAARLELELAALSSRIETIASSLDASEQAATNADGPRREPQDPVDRFTDRVVELFLDDGRTLASGGDDRVSVVVLVSEPGDDQPATTIQVSARAGHLPPAGPDPAAREAARGKIIVVKAPR